MVRVLNRNESLVDINTTNLEEWILEPQITGKKRNVQVFIDVYTNKSIRDFIKKHTGILKAHKIRVEMKHTKWEHTAKVGAIVGPNLYFTSRQYYEDIISVKN